MNDSHLKNEQCLNRNVDVDLIGATISLNNETDSESETNSEVRLPESVIASNANLNIENSNDVVVGTVTQFHGPVTIYQNTHNNGPDCEFRPNIPAPNDDEHSLTSAGNSNAHLVTTDALPRKHLPIIRETCTPKSRKILCYIIIIIFILVISVVISVVASRMLGKVPEIFDLGENRSTNPGSKHLVINRERWGARPPLYIRPMRLPVKYVIIAHSAGVWCDTIPACSVQMQQMQTLHVSTIGSPDIGYNFVIGGDANIYMGRGWDAHNFFMNLNTIGIGFIGNFVYDSLTPGMIDATQKLLNYGVEHGKLTEDYKIYAHNQTFNTQSPGINIYNQIKYWPHFSPEPLQDVD